MKKKKYTTIKIKEDDVAMVIKSNGDIQIFLPETNPDENASSGMIVMGALALLLGEKNKMLYKLIDKKIKELEKHE